MFFSHISITLGLIAYAAASGLYLHAFPKEDKSDVVNRIAFYSFVLATICLSSALASIFYLGYYSQTSGLILICTLSWFTIIATKKYNVNLMPTFVAPIITLILLFQFLTVPSSSHVYSEAPSGFAAFHILMAITGQAFSICASAISIILLLQQRALKTKKLKQLMSFAPSLDKLQASLSISLWSGFIFLTIGLITGALYSQFFSEEPQLGLGGKIIWALMVWIWYLGTLLAKNILNMSIKRVAQMSLIGFGLLALSFFGLITWGVRL